MGIEKRTSIDAKTLAILKQGRLPNPFTKEAQEQRAEFARQHKLRMNNLYSESVVYLRKVTGIDDVEIALKYLEKPVVNAISRDLKREQEWYKEIRSTHFVNNIQELYNSIVENNKDQALLAHAHISREYKPWFSGDCLDYSSHSLSEEVFGPLSILRDDEV